jgi:hypothetical protein
MLLPAADDRAHLPESAVDGRELVVILTRPGSNASN